MKFTLYQLRLKLYHLKKIVISFYVVFNTLSIFAFEILSDLKYYL